MKYWKCVVLSVALLLPAASVPREKDSGVVVQTDKFTGKTSVTMRPVHLGSEGLNPYGNTGDYYIAAGSISGHPKQAALMLFFEGNRIRFTGPAETYMLADDVRFNLGTFMVGSGGANVFAGAVLVSQTLTGAVDLTVIEKIASSKVVMIRFGDCTVRINKKAIERIGNFRSVLSRVVVD